MRADVVIVGAGMAGASLAAELAPYLSVVIIEAETQAGYHSTGRSAAFWSETYGGPLVQPLTSASGPFLAEPRADFSEDRPFLHPRSAIHLADAEGEAVIAEMAQMFEGRVALPALDRAELERLIPGLRSGWNRGLFELSCTDIDVAALHQAYLKAARSCGAKMFLEARLERARRTSRGWVLETRGGRFEAGILVNAAGAWADEVARIADVAPIGLQPFRRTIVQVRVDPPAAADLPLIVDALGRFYFKPEAGGRLWVSPHDETFCEPCDSAPEEIDVALAIDRLEGVVDWRVQAVEHSWAGLRTFAPDRAPVFGYSDAQRDFFWCAGQGGFGIQTAPAAAKLAASLLLDAPPDPMVAAISPEPYLASRFS